jgi:hypothetical protein
VKICDDEPLKERGIIRLTPRAPAWQPLQMQPPAPLQQAAPAAATAAGGLQPRGAEVQQQQGPALPPGSWSLAQLTMPSHSIAGTPDQQQPQPQQQQQQQQQQQAQGAPPAQRASPASSASATGSEDMPLWVVHYVVAASSSSSSSSPSSPAGSEAGGPSSWVRALPSPPRGRPGAR